MNPTQISSNSDKVVYDRFELDFKRACLEMKLVPEDEIPDTKPVFEPKNSISCSQMSHLYLLLGFIQPDGRDVDRTALASLWKVVGGDESGKELVRLQSVKVIMCAVQNFHIDWLIDDVRDDESFTVNPRKIGRFDGQKLYLRSEEITWLSRHYINLYKNR